MLLYTGLPGDSHRGKPTIGECLGETVSYGKAGCATTCDDEVVAAAKLGDLASDRTVRQSAGQGGKRADEEGIQDRHLFVWSSKC